MYFGKSHIITVGWIFEHKNNWNIPTKFIKVYAFGSIKKWKDQLAYLNYNLFNEKFYEEEKYSRKRFEEEENILLDDRRSVKLLSNSESLRISYWLKHDENKVPLQSDIYQLHRSFDDFSVVMHLGFSCFYLRVNK